MWTVSEKIFHYLLQNKNFYSKTDIFCLIWKCVHNEKCLGIYFYNLMYVFSDHKLTINTLMGLFATVIKQALKLFCLNHDGCTVSVKKI